MSIDYNEILKCYEGIDDIHASTSFEFGLMNTINFFTTMGIELLIGGCYALYTVSTFL